MDEERQPNPLEQFFCLVLSGLWILFLACVAVVMVSETYRAVVNGLTPS